MGVLREIQQRIDAHSEKILIREVAAATFTSPTSVVRLAKKLGYPGFSAMVYDMRAGAGHEHYGLRHGVQAYAAHDATQQAMKLAEMLASGNFDRVHVLGTGYSAYVAGYFCQRLQELGFFATEKSPLDFHDEAVLLAIFVSESGETFDLAFIQERCRMKGIADCVLSANVNSALCRKAQLKIMVNRQSEHGALNYFVVNSLIIVEDVLHALREMQEEEK